MFVFVIINTYFAFQTFRKQNYQFCILEGWKGHFKLQAIKKDFQDFQRHSQKHRDNEQQRSIRSNFLMVCF